MCVLFSLGIDIDDIDFSRYPSKSFQCKWIEIYLKEVSCLQGTFAHTCIQCTAHIHVALDFVFQLKLLHLINKIV